MRTAIHTFMRRLTPYYPQRIIALFLVSSAQSVWQSISVGTSHSLPCGAILTQQALTSAGGALPRRARTLQILPVPPLR
jgi:hypothetical protein